MKLTKQLEAEILKLYNGYWDAYLKGDVEAMHPLLANEYTQVGSAESEVFSNKKDAVQFLYDTIEQVAGKLEMRNRKTTLEQQEHAILIHEFCDLYALADGNWIFYSRFRASTIMQQKKEGWKITHQHSSFPDAKTEAGQNIAIDKIATENLLLREAIKRRTIELEQKNRHLEIESAVEKVRSRSMGMQKSEELKEVIKIVYQQLTHLKIKLDHAGFVVDYTALGDWHFWIADEQDIPSKITHPYFESVWANQFNEAKEKGVDLFATNLNFEEKNKFYNELLSHVPGLPEASRDFYLSCPGLAASTVLLENIGLYIENFAGTPYTDEENATLMRFGKVFQQTYTRFLDLQKAEAQAREAKIEAALERTRTQSMIMQHSNELDDTLRVFHEQVLSLGISSAFSFLWLPDEEKDRHIFWAAWVEDKNGLAVFNSKSINYPLDRNEPATAQCLIDWKGNEPIVSYHVPPSGVANYFAAWQELIDGVEKLKPEYFSGGLYYVEAFMKFGCFGVMVLTDLTEDEKKILGRFAKEFERAYTRFLDLQKAEAQAREAQIEAALERVRARTMAMQKSTDLAETSALLFGQLSTLMPELWTSGFVLCDKNKSADEWWLSGGSGFMPDLILPNVGDPLHHNIYQAWLKGESYYEEVIEGKPLQQHYEWLMTIPSAIAAFDALAAAGIKQPVWQQLSCAYFSKGYLVVITEKPCEESQLFKRFAQVFEQTYTRFLDLQKAEAQAREAQIETALERVRSRSLAMHKSDELNEVVSVLFERLKDLHIPFTAVGIAISIEGSKDLNAFVCGENEAGLVITNYRLPYFDNKISNDFNYVLENQLEYFVGHYSKEDKDAFYTYVLEHTPEFRQLPENIKRIIFDSASYTVSMMAVNKATFNINDFEGKVLADDEVDIIKRFAKVFDQAYTRFLDLQKAEAQTRESQIELALERVRARAMAMYGSGDILVTTTTAFEELKKLGIHSIRCGIGLLSKESKAAQVYAATTDAEGLFQTLVGVRDMNEHPSLKRQYQQWLKQETFVEAMNDEELESYYNKHFFQSPSTLAIPKHFNNKQYGYYFSFADGLFYSWNNEPYTEAEINILNRFRSIVALTFRRFLDLQKAETQARESQIEAALERVRSVAMSMMQSDDLLTICQSVFTQLQILGFKNLRAAQIYIRNDEEEKFMNYDYALATGADKVEVNYNSHPNTRRIYDIISNAGDGLVYNVIEKQQLEDWKSYLYNTLGQPPEESLDAAEGLHYYLYSFGMGAFGISTFNAISTEELAILKRFRNVFNLSYQRYTDIALAEAQSREARIETALERVRGRTLAMQKSDELVETAAVLFQQLIALGIEPNRLYMSIIKSELGETEFWITEEDGRKVSTAFAANMNDNSVFKKMFEGWKRQQKSLVINTQGEELQNYFRHLTSLGVPFKDGLLQKRRVQDIAYFNKGFIGIASPDEQPVETLLLLERFAAVFNLTFTRFNDLKIAEAHALQAELDLIAITEAKQKAEAALIVLQTTQKQLIQSEKMASLGELTAGIAHEIQNPLNFVNNFSDVSNELLDELMAEMTKGNFEEVKEILNDVKQNLEKINHHGKRADAIVKGMLQHSRSGSGVKEPTDINALADEYLRLAYHGLRAKDKSFNATLKTDFDKSIGQIKIVPQDIGMVILNLITNAFYAAPLPPEGGFLDPNYLHNPTVWVSTKRIVTPLGDGGVIISVRDNGPGIPQKILNKIFQPFFTTKPTGQGTGLGLSLSYDIVKAHGGEIKVETKEGEGSSFIIQLPIN